MLSASLPIVYLGGAEIIQKESPRSQRDFRQLMQHGSLDAIVIGTPDHWHPSLDCQSGKDLSICCGPLFFYGIGHPADQNFRRTRV